MSEENDEEWMKYASAGFGQTNYSLWEEEVEEEKNEPEAIQEAEEICKKLLANPVVHEYSISVAK